MARFDRKSPIEKKIEALNKLQDLCSQKISELEKYLGQLSRSSQQMQTPKTTVKIKEIKKDITNLKKKFRELKKELASAK